MRNVRRVRARRRAFTLLEVLMVLVILGLLASLVVYNLAGVGDKAKRDATKANIKLVEGAIDLFRAQVGKYPESLQQLVQKPENETDAANWAGPYIKDAASLKDSWGQELNYKQPGDYNRDSYDLSSPGEPGKNEEIANYTKT